MKAYLEIRGQHSRGSSSGGFGGPDTYVAVQLVPDGEVRLRYLNRNVAQKRGIKIVYCGEGYGEHRISPKSMLNRAITKGMSIVSKYNSCIEGE